jgi:hypothetical protein
MMVLSMVVGVAEAADSKALGLSWKGHVDTNLAFSEFFGANHTIALRFMPQYPNTYEGPLVAENGSGQFVIGQGDWLGGTSGTKLYLAVGSQARNYNVTLTAGQWHHLAVVATSTSTHRVFTLYLNGTALGSPLYVALSDAQLPGAGSTLRFGKRTTGQTINGRNAQYYGFIDDVAIFNRALSTAEIQSLNNSVLNLTGSESGLVAGYTFNTGSLPASLSRPVSLLSGAERIDVSTNRNNAADAPNLPVPSQHVEMTLPFPAGEAWEVIQGYDEAGGSHKGYASFCWDLVLADQPQSASNGKPFHAAAPGTVVTVAESNSPGGATNLIEVQQSVGEIAGYLHLKKDTALPAAGATVIREQNLAQVGDTGASIGAYHLHFAMTDKKDGTPGFVTFPIAFSHYEVRDAAGVWHYVYRGVPKSGDVIRAAAAPNTAVRYNAVWRPSGSAERQVHGVTYQNYRAAYDELWPQGWRLHSLQSYVVNNQVRYNAVFRPGTSSEVQVYGWSYQDFRNKYDELWPQGWRLHILQSYVLNGVVLYNAVWRPSTSGEIQVYGWSYQDFRNKYDELWPQGWRLHILQSYVLNGVVLYNAVWRPSTSGEIQVYGWSYQDFRNKYDELWPQGWRLHILQSYVINGAVRYNAVWRPGTSAEVQVYGWGYQDYRNKYDELSAQGWRLFSLDSYLTP